MTLVVEITPTIPDNEAVTALLTLRKLGVDLGNLERGDVWRFEVEPPGAESLVAGLLKIETVFNPNKHALAVRDSALPRRGETWIDEPGAAEFGAPPFRIAGRLLAGVTRIERFTAWRLFDRHGVGASVEVVERALETLLCNAAFQKAIR
jgi:hypothetical protein